MAKFNAQFALLNRDIKVQRGFAQNNFGRRFFASEIIEADNRNNCAMLPICLHFVHLRAKKSGGFTFVGKLKAIRVQTVLANLANKITMLAANDFFAASVGPVMRRQYCVTGKCRFAFFGNAAVEHITKIRKRKSGQMPDAKSAASFFFALDTHAVA